MRAEMIRSSSERGTRRASRPATSPWRVVARSRTGEPSAARVTARAASSMLSAGTAPSSGTPAAGPALVDLRADVARVDGGDRDPVALLQAQRVRVGDHAALAERVGGGEGDRDDREDARDVDHAPVRLTQRRERRGRHAPGAEEVDVEHGEGVLVRRERRALRCAEAGVVDQHVDAASEALDGHATARSTEAWSRTS